MFVKVLILLLASTQIAFAEDKRIEGAFGVLFNTDLAEVTESLEGRMSGLRELFLSNYNIDEHVYAITPPKPSKHLKGYEVSINSRTNKVYSICGTADLVLADFKKDNPSLKFNKYEAVALNNALSIALTSKYGDGRFTLEEHNNVESSELHLANERFAESDTQFIDLSYGHFFANLDLETPPDFNVFLCYVDTKIRDANRFENLKIEESSL